MHIGINNPIFIHVDMTFFLFLYTIEILERENLGGEYYPWILRKNMQIILN